ncbi:pre-rRNA-processing protein TSR2 homolog isoform X1 [Alosa sapidissima]|uniref:pre-rRNA-processing protein TSR2 homolog isoform X1 n=1 Tax=Alosa sapidissima TaxID=34773 RepID=UPI001C0A5D2C|nr:pre-rRNA-processing protein TSR2 homolog isoform X1 [Alosa sapidissima]
MAALLTSTREVFTEGVRAVLETWPVLQIAVDNGFGGVYSQQKAEWMVDAVQQYFHDNSDLQQYEVEDFISELMNNEFDTMVDDGSLPGVAQQVCQMFKQCQQGKVEEVKSQISQLAKKKSTGRVKATAVKSPEEEEESDEDVPEAMECEGAAQTSSSHAPPHEANLPAPPPDEAEVDDGWTVVRKKK